MQCVEAYAFMFVYDSLNVYSQIFCDTWTDIMELVKEDQFKSPDADIHQIMKNAKSKNFVKQYEAYFKRFQQWCNSKKVPSSPAKSIVVAIFLSGLIQQGVSKAVLCAFFTV